MRITAFFRIGNLTTIGLFLAGVLATPALAETKKLDSVALTVGDLGNPFFVQIAHGAEAQAKHINGKVKFTALSSNYDVKIKPIKLTTSFLRTLTWSCWVQQ